MGAAMEVLNEAKHGLHEKPYENSLQSNFGCSVRRLQQKKFSIFFKTEKDEYVQI